MQIGFDVGGSKIAVGIVNNDKKILARREIPFPQGKSYQEIDSTMVEMANALVKDVGVTLAELRSVGVSVPGMIDRQGERVIHAHNLGFHDVPLKEALSALMPGMEIRLANDANAATLAELHAGALRGCRTAVLLTLGTGVGGGLILGGRMFNGGLGHGVELGHMCLQLDGPLCTCGNRGCVETLCNAPWLIHQGRLAIEEHPHSLIATKAAGREHALNAKMVIDSAKEGDAIASKIFDRYVDHLSSAIVSCTNLLDPEVVALGGGVSLAGEFLFAPLREQVLGKSFFRHSYDIVPATLGNDAGIIGAAMLAVNEGET